MNPRSSLFALILMPLTVACGDDGNTDAADEAGDSGTTGDGDGDASGDGDGDPVDESCVSGTFWTMGDHESPFMHPGGDCIGCHQSKNEAADVVMTGTVYTASHEVDDCNGVPGVSVTITDANGAQFQTVTNSAGNFLFEEVNIVPPYSAHLEWEGRVRDMVGMQSAMSCNSCHTEQGAQAAPGRILAP